MMNPTTRHDLGKGGEAYLSQLNTHHSMHGVNAWCAATLGPCAPSPNQSPTTAQPPVNRHHPAALKLSHIALIQEPYTINNTVVGFPSDLRIFSTTLS